MKTKNLIWIFVLLLALPIVYSASPTHNPLLAETTGGNSSGRTFVKALLTCRKCGFKMGG